ncbi:hypothetical protein CLV53_101358 [Sediminibacterium magnilacihabitans]|nr:hypothetical protein CLV53_101358 [Sediminibacterium magnilacihabitans]
MLPLNNIPAEYVIFKKAGLDVAWSFIVALPKLTYSHIIDGICSRHPTCNR